MPEKPKSPSESYQRGFQAGQLARETIRQEMEASFKWAKVSYPASAGIDYAQEVLQLDKERIQTPPDLTRFPEARGVADLVIAERRGFLDGCGGDELALAFRFTWWFFMKARLNTRFVGRAIGTGCCAANCTAVFIRDSKEGGPLYGRNWDVSNAPGADLEPPRRGPDGKRRLFYKGVSCAVLCDEEPQEIFPLDAWDLIPEDCRRVGEVVEFLKRYADFWGPCNGIIVDEDFDCIAFEKSNCRMAVRLSDDGTAAVTACAALIPEMAAFREKCHRRSLELRGYDESSPDWKYWQGAEARYRRLLKLVKEAARRGSTLDDMAAIVTDHATPYPERICIAGQISHPEIPTESAEWTMRSRAAVLSGPNRRTLFWRVEGREACYENPPFLILGEGVKRKPAWGRGCRLLPQSSGPSDETKETYRQYEFDWSRALDA